MKLVPENINEAIKHLTPRSAKEMAKYAKTTTVEKFFKWYCGDIKWYDNDDLLTAMTIDNIHAEDEGKELEHKKFFKDNKNETITIYSIPASGDYDLEFNLKGKNISLQSLDPAMSRTNN